MPPVPHRPPAGPGHLQATALGATTTVATLSAIQREGYGLGQPQAAASALTSAQFEAQPFVDQIRAARAAMQRLLAGMNTQQPDYNALALALAIVTIRLQDAEKAAALREAVPA